MRAVTVERLRHQAWQDMAGAISQTPLLRTSKAFKKKKKKKATSFGNRLITPMYWTICRSVLGTSIWNMQRSHKPWQVDQPTLVCMYVHTVLRTPYSDPRLRMSASELGNNDDWAGLVPRIQRCTYFPVSARNHPALIDILSLHIIPGHLGPLIGDERRGTFWMTSLIRFVFLSLQNFVPVSAPTSPLRHVVAGV